MHFRNVSPLWSCSTHSILVKIYFLACWHIRFLRYWTTNQTIQISLVCCLTHTQYTASFFIFSHTQCLSLSLSLPSLFSLFHSLSLSHSLTHSLTLTGVLYPGFDRDGFDAVHGLPQQEGDEAPEGEPDPGEQAAGEHEERREQSEDVQVHVDAEREHEDDEDEVDRPQRLYDLLRPRRSVDKGVECVCV